MTRLLKWNNLKKKGLVFAAALTIMIGLQASGTAAQRAERLWSIGVHIEYDNGFVYDHVFASGVSTADMVDTIVACESSHAWGSAVRFHCYPVPE